MDIINIFKRKNGDFALSRIVAMIIALILLIFVMVFYGDLGEKIADFMGGIFR